MGELLEAFGIDWRILVINLINFGALLAILYYFLYGPIMRMLEERRERIAEGMRDAAAAAEQLAAIEAVRIHTLAETGKEADTILSSARSAGTAKEREIVGQAQATAAAVLNEAELQAADAKARAINESKEEVAKLIVLGMEKVMKGNLSAGRQEKL